MEEAVQHRRIEVSTATLAAIVYASQDAIISQDLNGSITSWNSGAERIFGYSAQEISGRSIDLIIPPDRQNEGQDVLNRLRRGESVDHFETVRLRRDGSHLDVSLTISPVRDANGFIIGVSHIARDITERKRLEALTRVRLDELETAAQRQGEFLSLLIHEIRNPLLSIGLNAEFLKTADPAGEDAGQAREDIVDEVRAMSRFLEDVLDVARISHGRICLGTTRLELGSILTRAVQATHSFRESRKQEIAVSPFPRSVYLMADPIRMEQIFTRLLHRASKYNNSQGHVWLTAELVGDESVEAVVRIRDDGNGIDSERLNHIFDVLPRLDSPRDRSGGSLAIDLAVVKSLTEMHGGRLEVHSAGLGQGTEFTVHLPLPNGHSFGHHNSVQAPSPHREQEQS